MTEEKYCDYCGEVVFIGSRIYEHRGLCICEDCARKYAWMLFEQEAKMKRVQSAGLINCDKSCK